MKVYWIKGSDTYHKKSCSRIESRSDLLSGDVEDALILGLRPCTGCFKRTMASVNSAVQRAGNVVYKSDLRKYDMIRWVHYYYPKEFEKVVKVYRYLKKTLDDETADYDLLQFFRIHSYTSVTTNSYKCMKAYFGIMNKPIVHDINWFNEQLKPASAGQKPAKQNLPARISDPPAKENKPLIMEAEYTVRSSTNSSTVHSNPPVSSSQQTKKKTIGAIIGDIISELIWRLSELLSFLLSLAMCVSFIAGGVLLVYSLFDKPSTSKVQDNTPRRQETSSEKLQQAVAPKVYTSRTYDVYCRINVDYNNHVGSDWMYDYTNIQVNGVDMGSSGVTLHEGDYIYPNVYVYEYDDGGSDGTWADPVEGFYITADDLQSGFNITITDLVVVEDHGRYAGNTAGLNVVFNFAPRD